jgi:D-methionine transport system ATP-binding protein
MITLEALNKSYQTSQRSIPALRDINLRVKPGEIYGIIGKSGAGKSTLIRCINLLERPSSGKVIVDGQDLLTLSASDLRKARRKIGMIFQHFNLLASRTVFENIAFPLELNHFSRHDITKTVMPLLELTGLADKKDVYPAELSGGQKQRVAIARALASQPKVLLSDEATSSLDPNTTQMILQLLKNIRDTLNLTIVLITHEMDVIKSCCDHVAILDHGTLTEENEVSEFFAYPKTALAKDFVASTLPEHLPHAIEQFITMKEAANTHPVMRFWFKGDTVAHPIVSKLIVEFGLRINIMQANIEYIKHYVIGAMIVAVDGDKDKLTAARGYLAEIGVQVEVIGYVPNDIIPFT